MGDYKKIQKTHLLASYQVLVPHWTGEKGTRSPFLAWSNEEKLPWYQAYNATKHDRHSQFSEATFEHLIDACCGLLILLSAQFHTRDFSPTPEFLEFGSNRSDVMESGIGGYFRVKFPSSWPSDLQYDFNWRELASEDDPFQKFDYTTIA